MNCSGLTLCFLLFSMSLCAQDLHFSQFYNQPQAFNPASAGAFRGAMRGAAIYRAQWMQVPVSYQTFDGSFDWKIRKRGKHALGLGCLLQSDRAGDGGLSWLQVGGNAALHHALNAHQGFSIGGGISMIQRSVNTSKLSFKSQWTGDLFDPGLPSNEPLINNSSLRTSLAAGLQWYWYSSKKRSYAQVGFGLLHLNRPELDFSAQTGFRLPMRVTIQTDCALQLSEWQDFVFFGQIQQMQKNQEWVAGFGLRQILSTGPGNTSAFRASLAYRWGDALTPAVQLERNNWVLGLSYDWNLSDFQIATNRRGGIEISLLYQLLPAPPLKYLKSCPIF